MAFEAARGHVPRSIRLTRAQLGMLALAAISMLSLSACDSRASMTPEDVINAFEAQPDQPITNPRDVTAERCGTDVPCEEAIQTDEIAVYSFDSKDDAADFSQSLGENGYQSNWIVLEYDGAAADTDLSKVSYAATVEGMWSSD